MKREFLLIIFCLIFLNSFAQHYGITGDGKYVYAPLEGREGCAVASTVTGWRIEVPDEVTKSAFSPDSRRFIYSRHDSLCIIQLGTTIAAAIPGVDGTAWSLSEKGNGQWLAYRPKEGKDQLKLYDLFSGKARTFDHVSDYQFDKRDRNILLILSEQGTAGTSIALKWLATTDPDHPLLIWSDTSTAARQVNVDNCVIDDSGTELAFRVHQITGTKNTTAIWYYRPGDSGCRQIASDESALQQTGLILSDETFRFTGPSSGRLILRLKAEDTTKADPKMVRMDVWNYQDVMLQSNQLTFIKPRAYAAVLNIPGKQIIRLEMDKEFAGSYFTIGDPHPGEDFYSANYAVIYHFDADIYMPGMSSSYAMDEYNWNKGLQYTISLVSLKDGSRKIILPKRQPVFNGTIRCTFSPDEKYIVYYDAHNKNYFSYEIATGKYLNLTKNVPAKWTLENTQIRPLTYFLQEGILNWLLDAKVLLVWDHYHDIWKFDLSGKEAPVNLSHGFFARKSGGQSVDIACFNYDGWRYYRFSDTTLIYLKCKALNDPLERYYGLRLDGKTGPILLSSGVFKDWNPIKAENSNHFIFVREGARQPKTFVYTRDFKQFTQIVKTTTEAGRLARKELVHWKTFDGQECSGILYYPVDFEPHKKYPVVFWYYELLSDEFNAFVDIPTEADASKLYFGYRYFTTHGYFYFEPDIHYTIGETGQSVYNSMVSAAKRLTKYPFIDASKMGVSGHSFGGYETNLLISKTHIFAAACSGSGLTDMLSSYLSEDKDEHGFSHSTTIQQGQLRLGVTPWERPDIILKNSPVFYADRITTPLLMGIGRLDHRVPFSQGIELFTALRRLGRPAWLISYDDRGHNLDVDWDTRRIQFFNHYLKGEPAPVWMTRGIPARMKGRTLGLELDTTVKTPGPGLLIDHEISTPEQQKLLKHKTTVDDNGRIVNVKTNKKIL